MFYSYDEGPATEADYGPTNQPDFQGWYHCWECERLSHEEQPDFYSTDHCPYCGEDALCQILGQPEREDTMQDYVVTYDVYRGSDYDHSETMIVRAWSQEQAEAWASFDVNEWQPGQPYEYRVRPHSARVAA